MNDYCVGIDIGTNSVGFAVTDMEYNLIHKYGKDLWGARLFDSAKTAAERRIIRTSRRRLDRRNWRIGILQELFSEEISAVDPGFFLRMKESKYYPEDKRDMSGKCPELPYALFVGKGFTDKEYHSKFATIYHLRKYLMETDEIPDIRLVYLAIHHMMKHRGHFLFSGDISQIKNLKSTLLQLVENLKREDMDWKIEITDENVSAIEKTLKDKNLTRSDRNKQLKKLLHPEGDCENTVLELISGSAADLNKLFPDAGFEKKVTFADSAYEDKKDDIESILGEQFYIIESIKAVYDWATLVEILDDSSSLSDAKIYSYQKHQKDLVVLKRLLKKYYPQGYNEMFVASEKKLDNYCAYVGTAKKNNKKIDIQHRCSKQEFMKHLGKILEKLPDSKEKTYILNEIGKEDFLPKQTGSENSVIPYQLHLSELKKIISNLEMKIPFLKENGGKIVQLFEFRVPYYVGPLNYTGGVEKDYTWSVRNSNEKIYPWNFDKIVDAEASAERFIRRMTNKCTYLVGEDVLPKDSLLYRKFMVLNELNNLCINGEHISVNLKQDIYENLFCKNRKVTVKKLKNHLKTCGYGPNMEITGIDGEFKTQLTSYHDFKEKLTGVVLSENEKEEIIQNIVLFGDSKKLLKQRISRMFPQLTEKQLKSICSLKYKGWGNLSRKFLSGITSPVPGCSEEQTIIGALWNSEFEEGNVKYCPNLQQLLSKTCKFKDIINTLNDVGNFELNYDTVSQLYVSPAVKRAIWQTIKIVDEIKRVMGQDPKRVFVEMARGEENNKERTSSRKKQLDALYEDCKKEIKSDAWYQEVAARLRAEDDQHLRSKKLYLYYRQFGRCMYSEEPIPFEDLWDNNKYDIDHIYPRSKTKDDSFDNLVLVKHELNHEKDDKYPIEPSIQKARRIFWKMLKDKNLISQKKYERLIRKEELTPTELAGFISRQMVETRQSTKAVAEILKKALPTSEIVYVKASTVSEFRHTFSKEYPCMVKVRDMNDLHHAKDAYLNIIVGNAYYVKFTKDAAWYIRNNPGRTYNLAYMFKGDKNHSVKDIESAKHDEVAWKVGPNGTIVTVAGTMKKNNILVTRMSFKEKGVLFDQQPLKKGKGQYPLKTSDERISDISKYGGYNSISSSFFVLVESKRKKDTLKRTIEYIPVYLRDVFEKNRSAILEYLKEDHKLTEPRILLEIKTDSLLSLNGSKVFISGRDGNNILYKNANQLLLDDDECLILKAIMKFEGRKKSEKNICIAPSDNITEESTEKLYDAFVQKINSHVYNYIYGREAEILNKGKDKFLRLSLEEKCQLLLGISRFFNCSSSLSDLKKIGGSGSAGRIRKGKEISKLESCIMINQSVTGVFEKKVNLLGKNL